MTREEFIFTKKVPQRLYRHTVFWLAYYLFSLLVYFHDGLEKVGFGHWAILEVWEVFFHVIPQMIFCYTILYYLLPSFWYKQKNISFFIGITLLSIGVYWFYFLEHIFIFKAIHYQAGLPFRPIGVVYWFTMISFFTFFPISAGLVIAIKTLKDFYIKLKENQQLSRENANAELQLLKAQIHPHFLFNTLNNIYSFALNKSPEASGLVGKLSDTIHYMITDCNTSLVTFGKEVKMLEDYIALEKVRYGNRLEIKLDVTSEHDDMLIAPLLMIPFLENCFKHGTSMMTGKQWIHLSIVIQDDLLNFKISNSKPPDGISLHTKHGIGLQNVKKRLALLYPGRHVLNISSGENIYSVEMQVQLQAQSIKELTI
jgi:two-component system LytT family sensor kinase